jgi:potassium-transporting ATPase ATP-binding subunit
MGWMHEQSDAGDCTTLLLDKTGTITFGSRQASEFIPVHGVEVQQLAEAASASSLTDETPEGRSIVGLASDSFGQVVRDDPRAVLVPFTAQTRMSGMDFQDGRSVRKGASDSVRRFVDIEYGIVL